MRWRNDSARFGLLAISLHWLTALLVVALFGLGLWMTSLTYYDLWYRQGPLLHKSLGVLLFALLLARLAWRWLNPPPAPLASHRPWERRLAHAVHGLLYLLLFAVMIFGYLISTADGRPLEIFSGLAIPATLSGKGQEEWAGELHLWLACTLIALVAAHAGAALKHQLIDRDHTLARIFGR